MKQGKSIRACSCISHHCGQWGHQPRRIHSLTTNWCKREQLFTTLHLEMVQVSLLGGSFTPPGVICVLGKWIPHLVEAEKVVERQKMRCIRVQNICKCTQWREGYWVMFKETGSHRDGHSKRWLGRMWNREQAPISGISSLPRSTSKGSSW